ncbi:sensor histidine kinase [Pedobacter aquatilis]|uniref:sensor histidine kinase n=1 Tax=Pedobacter aquatilis TaxID=351343 RepID=UPI00292E31F0|nr:ATP-binding protein [Pedobacter aquatilis]
MFQKPVIKIVILIFSIFCTCGSVNASASYAGDKKVHKAHRKVSDPAIRKNKPTANVSDNSLASKKNEVLLKDSVAASLPPEEPSVLKTTASWFQGWAIEIVIFLVLGILLLYLLYKNSRIKVYSKARYMQQKKYIAAERQRISSEMHDEIGAGLSAIKLFSEMAARNRKDVDEIRQINVMVNDIADKINEIIWSTNADSDNLESLFDFIEGQSRKLFEHSNINFTASLPYDIPEGSVSSQVRRNNYLLIKEIVHNALKHSQATTVHLSITINNGLILYNVKDNGIGFDPNKTKINSMGLSNVKLRIEKLKGSFIIENYKGTSILIKIPVNAVITADETKRKRFYFF